MASLFSKKLWNRDFVLILLICTIASFPNAILISVLPVYVLDLGGSDALTGLMMTGLTVLGMVTNLAVAPLIDRVGRKKLLVLGSGLYFVNALLFCFTRDLNALFALRVLCGFSQGIFFPVPPVIASDISPKELMVDAMGIFGAAGSLTFAVAPAIGLAIYRSLGPTAMFAAAAAMGGVSFALALLVRERYQVPEKQPRGKAVRGGLRLRGPLLWLMLMPSAINLIACFGNSAVSSFLIPCGLSRGLEGIALFSMVNQGAVIVSRLMIGRVLGRVSKKNCVLIGILLTAAGTALIAAAHSMAMMLAAAVLIGVGITAVTQLLQAETLITVPADRRGMAGTAYMLMGNIGTGLGAAALGAVSTASGYSLTYALAGGLTLLSLPIHFPYWHRREAA